MAWHIFEVRITRRNARPGYPAGVWARVCYRSTGDSIVQRLAAQGVTAYVRDAGPETD
jgi:hypothetical protein